MSDPHVAKARLLPLLLKGGQTTVSAFGRKQHNLDEIFLQMIEGGPGHETISLARAGTGSTGCPGHAATGGATARLRGFGNLRENKHRAW